MATTGQPRRERELQDRPALDQAHPDLRGKPAFSTQVVAMDDDRDRRAASDRYAGYKQLVNRAEEVFGDAVRSSLWLSTPSADFDGDIPLRIAEGHSFDEGFLSDVFEPVFLRIEHGIYT